MAGKEFALYDRFGRAVWYSVGVPGDEDRQKNKGQVAWQFSQGEDRERIQAAVGKAILGTSSTIEVEATIQGHKLRFRTHFEPMPFATDNVAVIATFWILPTEILVLSRGERLVASWMAKGMSTKQIAAQMDVSPSTIDSYRAKLKAKLRMSTSQLIAWCVSNAEILAP